MVLGDRPIDITLQRCWDAVSWRRRWEIAVAVRSFLDAPPTPAEARALYSQKHIDSLKSAENLERVRNALERYAPEIVSPFVHERDLYLAWSMQRSKAANGAKRVVAIVGVAHLRGIMWALTSEAGGVRFSDLVGQKNTRAWKDAEKLRGAVNLARDTLLFGGLAWAWSAWNP